MTEEALNEEELVAVSFLDCPHTNRSPIIADWCLDCEYWVTMPTRSYLTSLQERVSGMDEATMLMEIRRLEKLLGIKQVVITINGADSNCICARICDCANPEPEEGVAGVSNGCPEHNDPPEAHPECPAVNHFKAWSTPHYKPDIMMQQALDAADLAVK